MRSMPRRRLGGDGHPAGGGEARDLKYLSGSGFEARKVTTEYRLAKCERLADLTVRTPRVRITEYPR